MDMLDESAKEQLRDWFEAAKRDALCLERWGDECDRRDRPRTIAIGQDQFHPCARGYVFDCRAEPCRLLDYIWGGHQHELEPGLPAKEAAGLSRPEAGEQPAAGHSAGG